MRKNTEVYVYNEGKEIKELLDDLNNVGPAKPMGYLPLATIRDFCHKKPRTLYAEALKKGLKAVILPQNKCRIGSGALYLYDKDSLQTLLDKNPQAFVDRYENWPRQADEFVMKVITESAEHNSQMCILIGRAFNDPRFR